MSIQHSVPGFESTTFVILVARIFGKEKVIKKERKSLNGKSISTLKLVSKARIYSHEFVKFILVPRKADYQ